jgi:hypothetical protein
MKETQIFQSCDTALDNSQLSPAWDVGQVQQTRLDERGIWISTPYLCSQVEQSNRSASSSSKYTGVSLIQRRLSVFLHHSYRPTHMKKQEKTVSTPPYRRRRLLSHVWDTMPCSQDRSGKAQPHNACSESQPRSAQELLPCHAMPPCHGSQPEITHPPPLPALPSMVTHRFFFPTPINFLFYTFHSTCSPMRSRPTSKKDTPWNRRK